MPSTVTDRVTGLSTSVAVKAPCRVATTANITLSGEQTIDVVAVVDGDRVLVKNQTSSANNGIYYVSTTAWSRAEDFDGSDDVVSGTTVFVLSGTVGGSNWYQATVAATPPVIGTTAITFAVTYAGLTVVTTASETAQGIAEIATQAETSTGTDDVRIITPLKLKTNLQATPYDTAIVSTDAGATEGPTHDLYRNSASPAISDLLGVLSYSAKSSTAVKRVVAKILGLYDAVTNAAESASLAFQTIITGTLATRMTLSNGLWMVGSTGGDKGAGTINSTGYYTNGTRSDPGTYLEGTFTPAVAFGGAAVGVTYTTQAGTYTRIGNRVFFTVRIVLTANGSSVGSATVTGLPIAAGGSQIQTVPIRAVSGFASLTFNPVASIASGTTIIDLYQGSSTATVALTDTNVADAANFIVSGSYQV